MKERLELISLLEQYESDYAMSFDSSNAIRLLIQSLKEEEEEDGDRDE